MGSTRRVASPSTQSTVMRLMASTAGRAGFPLLSWFPCALKMPENQQHPGEVCKMLVHRKARWRGIAVRSSLPELYNSPSASTRSAWIWHGLSLVSGTPIKAFFVPYTGVRFTLLYGVSKLMSDPLLDPKYKSAPGLSLEGHSSRLTFLEAVVPWPRWDSSRMNSMRLLSMDFEKI